MSRQHLAQRLAVLLLLASTSSLLLTCGGLGTGTTGPGPGPQEPVVSGAWIIYDREVRQGNASGPQISYESYPSISQAPIIYLLGGGEIAIFRRGANSTTQTVEGFSYVESDSTLSFGSSRLKAWVELGRLVIQETMPDSIVRTRFDAYNGTVPPLPSGWPLLDTQRPDAFELDNRPADATWIPPGGTSQSHSCYPVGDEDWYSFPAKSGADYIIDCRGVADIELRVFDTDGLLMLQYAADSNMVWNCTRAGTYFFVAKHLGLDTTIWYSVTLTEEGGATVDRDAAEPDNDAFMANPIDTKVSLTRTISPAGDVDWFSFVAKAGVSYTMQTRGDLDTWIELYNTNGSTSLDNKDGGGSGANGRITWTCPQDGKYYFKVSEKQPTVTGEYLVDLVSNGSAAGDVFEPDNSAGDANQLLINAPVQRHELDPASDDDFLFFNATSGTTYLIATQGTTNTYMVLYNADKTTRIQENDDYDGVNAGIMWTCDLTGRYYVRVNEFGYNATGSYTIDVVTK